MNALAQEAPMNVPFPALQRVSMNTFADFLADADGHAFYSPEVFTDAGFPPEFILPLNGPVPHDAVRTVDPAFQPQKRIAPNELRAVFELDFWWALAEHVGADTKEAAMKCGRGTQARELRDAIVLELEKHLNEPKCLDCDRLAFMRGRCSQHFGWSLVRVRGEAQSRAS
jgi:hypothetical protein